MLTFLRSNAPWLAAGALLTFSSSYGQTYFISIFAGEIRAEFGLTDGQWGRIYTLGTAGSAAVMVWAGALTDVFRVRVLAMVVLPMLALACLSMAFVHAAWALPLVIFALRFSGQGMSSHIATVAMARWFQASRGKALSVASLGFSLGEALLPMAFVALMVVIDWRWIWVVAALLALLAAPATWALLRTERTPQSEVESSQSTGMLARHWTRKQVLRHWLFWLMVPLILGPSAFGTAFFFQQVHLAEVKGWSHVGLVALFPIYTASAIVAMIGSGIALDRFGTAPLIPFFQLPLAAGFVILSSAQTLLGAAVALVLMGITTGGNATLPAAFWAEFFGTRHLGAIKATATAVMVLGSAIGPGLSGTLIDWGYPFPAQMIGIALFFGFSCLCTGLGVRRAVPLLPAAP